MGSPGAADVFTPEDLDSEQRLIGETAAGFGKDQVAPLLEKIENREHEHSVALMRQAGELGLLGVDIPAEYDGLGLTTTSSTLITEALGRYAGSFSLTFGAHTGIGTLPIVYFGNEDQKQRYLPKLASGEWIAAYALTEPDAGSDALAAKTTATLTPDGKHYVLNGQKCWITNASYARWYVVFATADPSQRHKSIGAFIVDRESEGLKVGKKEDKLGQRASDTAQVFFEDMKKDLASTVRQVADFLGVAPLSDSELANVVHKCSFAYMQEHQDNFEMHPPHILQTNAELFVSGTADRYKNVPAGVRAQVAAWVLEEMEGSSFPLLDRYGDLVEQAGAAPSRA